ncbi:MAG: L-seryl-tRNA(Sec) selenium transferase [Phycisphaerales bacterium]|nr:L-seryl-tRNA(Sec) selenium transferase [Phycisphaerales bacterium]
MNDGARDILRSLPSVSTLLAHPEVELWTQAVPRSLVTASLRSAVDQFRDAVLSGGLTRPVEPEDVIAVAEDELTRRSLPSLRRVINATGVVLHTGLGRAPLCDSAIEAIVESARGYCNLEFDLDTGRRGRRMAHVADRLAEVTGAEASLVVNNNAAATLLILHVLAKDREVVVSRGQLIEIGGSFRLPEIMAAGGAILREVGTTNRTRVGDYEAAIGERTAILLRAHSSNFRIVGFTEEASIADLAALAHSHGLILVDDLGSGAIFDLARHGLPAEPWVKDSLARGADLVCFSGDKLLGGPQCGILVGRRELIERIGAHPLMRTYRVDKLTLAALEATLRHYADEEDALRFIPALQMLTAETETLVQRGDTLAALLKEHAPTERFYVGSDSAFAGGGALPGVEIPTVVVRWTPASLSTDRAVEKLRQTDPPVIARIHDDAICFDLRTLRPDEFEELASAVAEALVEVADESDEDSGDIPLPVV